MSAAETHQLRGTRLPTPRFRIAPLSKELEAVKGFHDLQTFFPTLSKIYRLSKHQADSVWLDSKWRIASLDISGTSGPCAVRLVPNVDVSGGANPLQEQTRRDAYLKVTHLLDPIRWMKGAYSLPKHAGLPWHNKTWMTASQKLQDPWNQAYVETMASYALGRLREENLSPHFNHFYGAFCASAEVYRYNLTTDFASMRLARWFWGGIKRGMYSIKVINKLHPDTDISNDANVQEYLRQPSESELDRAEYEETDDEESEDDEIKTESVAVEDAGDAVIEGSADAELESLHSDALDGISYVGEEPEQVSRRPGGLTASSYGSNDSLDDIQVYAEFKDFPVMLIAVDKNQGTMDSLLEESEERVGAAPGTPEWELRWSAWLFQVIAALSCAQTLLGFTHNDLHTNNIVWSPTTEEWLYYTNRAGAVFRVPTFGKIFRIIDFGRAIFTINGYQFISDDFKAGNDAEGQYCFRPLHPRPPAEEEVSPNPSFDLCRLAVSLFESLYPETPDPKKGGKMLSSEDGLEMAETVSPLFNVLWSWMIDDEGRNVLIESNGEERFPDFDLYKHIAAHVHKAVPAQQFSDPAFDQFQVAASEVPAEVKRWALFC